MGNKLKIAIVTPTLLGGGAERVAVRLSNYFSERYEMHLISLILTKSVYEIKDDVTVHFLDKNLSSSFILSAIKSNFRKIRRLKSYCKENEIDILLGFTTSVNVICISAAESLKIPVIISERNNAKIVPPNSFWRILRNLTYPLSNQLVVQTQGNRDFYREIVNVNKIKIIPNPIESVKTKIANKSLNQTIEIITVGRLTENKAVKVLIQALNSIKELNWRCTIVGDGILREQLEKQIANLGLNNKFHFTGYIEVNPTFYENYDIFAFTSRSEGFPNALLEAYASGLPCVSTNCPFGPSEIITDGFDGFLVPVDDWETLADRIKMLIDKPELRVKFSRNALTNANKFTIEKVAKEWEALITQNLNTI